MNIGNTVYFKQINIPIVAASANGKAFSLALDIAGNEVDQRRDVSFERRIYQLSPRSLAKCTADGRDDLGRALRKTERKKEERLKSRRNKKKKKKKSFAIGENSSGIVLNFFFLYCCSLSSALSLHGVGGNGCEKVPVPAANTNKYIKRANEFVLYQAFVSCFLGAWIFWVTSARISYLSW